MFRDTSPVIKEQTLSISIKDINKLFNLKRIGERTGSIAISQTNQITGQKQTLATMVVTVHLNNEQNENWIEIGYQYGTIDVMDRIRLIPVRSNLDNGSFHHYFLCPVTKNRCRKLFLNNGHWTGKAAIKGFYYSVQVASKKHRPAFQLGRDHNRYRKMQQETLKPYHKGRYGGLRTRKIRKMEWAAVKLGKLNKKLWDTF